MLNFPFSSVVVRTEVPFSKIFTSFKGPPASYEATRPSIINSGLVFDKLPASNNKRINDLFIIIFVWFTIEMQTGEEFHKSDCFFILSALKAPDDKL